MSLVSAPVWNGLEDLRPVLVNRLRTRCRDENELDDLIQETFLRAARYRAAGEPRRLTGWLVSIARNVQHDTISRDRRGGTQEGPQEILEQIAGREPEPGGADEEVLVRVGDRLVERRQLLRHLALACQSLREEDALVLEGHYRRAESSLAIAHRLQIAPAMVKVRLYRARRRLRRRVESLLARESGGSMWADGTLPDCQGARS